MSGFPRAEVEKAFRRWRDAVDVRDVDAMLAMYSEDAEVGNAVYGLSRGEAAIRKYLQERSRTPDRLSNAPLPAPSRGRRRAGPVRSGRRRRGRSTTAMRLRRARGARPPDAASGTTRHNNGAVVLIEIPQGEAP